MNDRLLNKLLKLHRVEYLVTDRSLIILEMSANAFHFAEATEAIDIGQDVRLGFPELVGFETQLDALKQQQDEFTLSGVARSSTETQPLYIDLHIECCDDCLNNSENKLLILVEDVSERMILGQQLVQRVNETELLLQTLTEQNAVLEKAKYAADAANRAKSAFLAMMSHEIRTPMNGVIGTAEMLLNSSLTVQQRQLAEIINTSGQSLLNIIDDILDFSKIEAGMLELESQPFNLRVCVQDAIGLLAAQALEKGIELTFLDQPSLPNLIVGDITRLRQILINLIGNAIKFTEVGEVTVSATACPLANDRYAIQVAIRDTGIGIPTDRLNSLFQEFSQVDASITRKYGGTGLGLAISKRLCELMGGKIWVESQPGRGSTFCFTFETSIVISEPIARTAAISLNPLEQSNSLKILLAEDHPINQRLMLLMLDKLGHQVDVVNNGLEVLSALRRQTYDVILMDIQMPKLDGIATAQQIGREWKAADRPQIIALTASAMEQDRQHCLQAGMSNYLTKPVRSEELARVLSQCRSRFENWAIDSSQISEFKSDAATTAHLIDPEALLQLQQATRHSVEFVVEIIDLYFQEAPKLLETMRNSLDRGDCKSFRRAVHTLQACSASMGAIRFSEKCKTIEEIVRSNNLSGLAEQVIEIETVYQDVQAALQQERQKYICA